jgi:Protein of unknown function (DUF3168)
VSVEASIYTALKSLVNNRVYRDIAPQTVIALPRITFQQVGGDAVNFLDPTVPSKKNARFQVNCWGERRDDVMALARDVEDTLRAYTVLQATVLGAPVALYEEETRLYGAMQDYSFWFDD